MCVLFLRHRTHGNDVTATTEVQASSYMIYVSQQKTKTINPDEFLLA